MQLLEDEEHRSLDAKRVQQGPHVGKQPHLGILTVRLLVASARRFGEVRYEARQDRRRTLAIPGADEPCSERIASAIGR